MLEITGGASATALAFIFPAMCYIKLSAPHEPWYSRSQLPTVACASFGVVVLCISPFLTLDSAKLIHLPGVRPSTPDTDARVEGSWCAETKD